MTPTKTCVLDFYSFSLPSLNQKNRDTSPRASLPFPKGPEPSGRRCPERRDVLQSPPSSPTGASLLPPPRARAKLWSINYFYNLFLINLGLISLLKAGEPFLWAIKGLGGGKMLARDGMRLLPNRHLRQLPPAAAWANTGVSQFRPFPAHFPFDLFTCHAPLKSKQMSERSAPRPPRLQPVPKTPLWSRPRSPRPAVATCAHPIFLGNVCCAWIKPPVLLFLSGGGVEQPQSRVVKSWGCCLPARGGRGGKDQPQN